jgi:hypothetical protein
MAETSLREGVREMREELRPGDVKPKLEEAVQNQPLLPHLLSFPVVLKALAIGAVVAVILFVLVSPLFAGVGLLFAFFGSWFGLATLSYGKAADREKEEKAEEEEDDEG